MTSKNDILHNALRANGFEPDEKLTPLAYIAAADALASRCAELEKAMLQARADRDHNERVIARLQAENADLKRQAARH